MNKKVDSIVARDEWLIGKHGTWSTKELGFNQLGYGFSYENEKEPPLGPHMGSFHYSESEEG